MRNIIFIAIFVMVGMMAMHQFIEWQRLNQVVEHFMAAGPRFTAGDGQALCLRIRELERAANLPYNECRYAK